MKMMTIVVLIVFLFIGTCSSHQEDHSAITEVTASTISIPIPSPQRLTEGKRPVIFLDVDGVINFMCGIGMATYFWSDALMVSVPSGQLGSPPHEIVYSPTVINKLNEWSKVADIHWLTSWGERANTHLAPAIGLEGPFVTMPHDTSIKGSPRKVQCAQAHADQLYPDQLLIWLDDSLPGWLRVPDEGLPTSGGSGKLGDVLLRPNTLYVAPKYGLTPRLVELVDKYLADPDLAKGKMSYAFKETEDKEEGSNARTFTKEMFQTCTAQL